VRKLSAKIPTYLLIKELILEKNLSNVKYVRKHSTINPICQFIEELILEKNLLNVMYARNVLLQVPI
jgi:hypothetical protein